MAKHGKRQRKFRYGDDNQPSGIPASNKIFLRTKEKLELIRPVWDAKAKGPLSFRPLPAFNPDDPDGPFDDTRLSETPFDYSEFMISVPCAAFAGTTKKKLTCALWDPSNHGYSPYSDNPYVVFYAAIRDALEKGEARVRGRNVASSRWSKLMPMKKEKPLSPYKRLHFLQALIYAANGKVFVEGGGMPFGAAPGSPLPIVQLSQTAGRAIASKLALPNEEYHGETTVENQDKAYMYGELVSLTNGKIVTVYNHAVRRQVDGVPPGDPIDDPAVLEAKLKKHGLQERERRKKSKDDDDGDGGGFYWSAAITPKFRYTHGTTKKVRSADISKYEDEIRNKLQFWEDLINFPTTDELAFWVAEAFSDYASAFEFAWADNPEFFTEEVRGVLARRTTAQSAFPDDDDDDDRGSRRIRRRLDDEYDDEEDDDRRGRSSRRRRRDEEEDVEEDDGPRRRRKGRGYEEDEEEAEDEQPRRRRRRQRDEEVEEEEERPRRRRRTRDEVEEVDEVEEYDDEDDVDDSGRDYSDDLDEIEEEEEEEEEERRPRRKSPSGRARRNSSRRSEAYADEVDDDDLPDTGKPVPTRRSTKKRRKTRT